MTQKRPVSTDRKYVSACLGLQSGKTHTTGSDCYCDQNFFFSGSWVSQIQRRNPPADQCLTVRNQDQRPTRASHELRTDDLPTCEESPMPTLEEVNAWAQSFDKLMITPAGRNAFREFLRTEFSEENMLFWMACEELKKEANKNMIEEKARIIYDNYISTLSPKEVSLDSRVREVIDRNMGEPSQHVFDDAQLQIYTLMHRDSYPRFMNSALYKDLLQSLSEKSVEA
ncbi:regulator of G-protein signaling 20 isoform X2 [Nycticebus coucang]|uniref:regulator of G-protein signaling 20 isoform X2 n=1 Tax=Nycticebus coucang TaxID=9470 RepID=UPI00234C8E70|nr:regulator of G-protein signaling 20 isoform X2 [Nycticebus coucang]